MTNTPQALAKQRAQRRANIAAGLTFNGRQRKNYLWPELAHLTGRARMNERIRICTNRYRKAKRIEPKLALKSQIKFTLCGWREGMVNSLVLTAEIEAAVAAINAVYEKLDPAAKAKSLELAHTLAGIRMKLSRA